MPRVTLGKNVLVRVIEPHDGCTVWRVEPAHVREAWSSTLDGWLRSISEPGQRRATSSKGALDVFDHNKTRFTHSQPLCPLPPFYFLQFPVTALPPVNKEQSIRVISWAESASCLTGCALRGSRALETWWAGAAKLTTFHVRKPRHAY